MSAYSTLRITRAAAVKKLGELTGSDRVDAIRAGVICKHCESVGADASDEDLKVLLDALLEPQLYNVVIVPEHTPDNDDGQL